MMIIVQMRKEFYTIVYITVQGNWGGIQVRGRMLT